MRSRDLPDILFVSVDTMRRDCMAPYGRDLMPAATRLLEEGVAFDNCFAAAPWTGSSFGSMFTGLWPRQHGCLVNILRRGMSPTRAPLRRDVPLLAEMLQQAGYFTICTQANHGYLGPSFGFARGFDEYLAWYWDRRVRRPTRTMQFLARSLRFAGPWQLARFMASWVRTRHLRLFRLPHRVPMQDGDAIGRTAARFLGRSPPGRPVFLWVNFIDVHMPYTAPRKWMPRFEHGRAKPVHLDPSQYLDDDLDEADKQYIRLRYDGAARYVDACIADLLNIWRLVRGRRSRLTLFASDHGEEFWEHGDDRRDVMYYGRGVGHGHTLFNEQLRVPLVFHWPEAGIRSAHVDSLVSMVDLTPTLVHLLGLAEDTSHLAGRSLALHLTSQSARDDPMRVIFADSIQRGPQRQAAISATHKLIKSLETDQKQLFDWAADPAEETDLVGVPSHEREFRRLVAALAEWSDSLEKVTSSQAFSPEEEEEISARLRDLGYL